MNPSEAKHNEKKKKKGNEVNWLTMVKKTELINLGLAVSRWHRYPKLAFTSGTDEMFIQKKQ